MGNLATNFSQKDIDQINEILKFVMENSHSDFYRKKYAGLSVFPIKSYEDFQKIPFLTKDEIISTPLEERFFVPKEQISFYTFSSGTTNNKKLTVMAHTSDYDRTNFQEEKILSSGATKVLIMLPPTSTVFYKTITSNCKQIRMIPGDIHNLPISALISRDIKIDGLMTTATLLELFIQNLKDINFDFEKIKWISLGGEFCSKQKFEYFKSNFPSATFLFRFGTSEVGPRGYRCQIISKEVPSMFHPTKNSLIEIIDESNNTAVLNQSGEMIHTDLSFKCFPLIRYKTRDMGTLMKNDCQCGMNYSFELGGRSQMDVLRISGGILNVQAIEDSLHDFSDFLEPGFQMHVFEKEIGGKIKNQLEIHLRFKKQFLNKTEDINFLEQASENISKKLKISKKSNLNDLIEKGLFLPLKLKFVDSFQNKGKAKHIISHIE